MKDKKINILLNAGLISLIIIGLAFGLLMFPMQTNLLNVIVFPDSFAFATIDVAELIVYYLSLVSFLCSIILLFIAKNHYLTDKPYLKTLFLACLVFGCSGLLMFVSNIVFSIVIHIISFEIIYALLGAVMVIISVIVSQYLLSISKK